MSFVISTPTSTSTARLAGWLGATDDVLGMSINQASWRAIILSAWQASLTISHADGMTES
ncbi:hypothetical protein CBOM_04218 [Ceraceosorus bombacis]|uniref:Uncharacterized protein n=1 Tax=Ceraceosorus bombacis TaxID=401625 RepID=A0A0P1BM61_9BASI|nr:hypothetical protein CBOM_04218 [Ceraceosorus bombacis]